MKFSLKELAVAVIALVVPLALLAGLLIVLMIVFEYSDGMQPGYRAADYDARLTAIAREAVPIIQLIDRYYKAHGHCPHARESDWAELRKSFPEGLVATFRAGDIEFRTANATTGWLYHSADEDSTACSLWRKLGWDPALVWLRRGNLTKWIFIPGDGSEEKAITLDIGW